MLTTVKKMVEIGFLVGTLLICGCMEDGRSSRTAFGAFNDETYVWESYQFTTNQIRESK